MRHRPAVCLLALLPAAAIAQGPPTFVPKANAMAIVRVDDVPAIAAALPATRLGRLLAQPDVAAAWATGVARHRTLHARTAQLLRTAIDLQVELESRRTGAFAERLFWVAWDEFETVDLRDVLFAGIAGPEADGIARPRGITVVRCAPRVEGKATQRFEAAARDVEHSGWLTPSADAKVGGVPARVFAPKAGAEDEPIPTLGAWLVLLPGTIAFGSGTPEECGTLGAAAPAPAGASMHIDMTTYVAMLTRGGVATPAIQALGIDALRSLHWQVAFAGDALRDDLTFAFASQPTGLLGSLLAGTAPLVRQALPPGTIAQLRTAADVPMLLDAVARFTGGELPFDRDTAAALQQVLTGGLAVGVAAPAPGGLLPRMFVSLGVHDEEAASALLAKLLGDEHGKQVEHDGVAMRVLAQSGLPAAFQPTFCVHGGALHVTESVASMRALLKAQQGDADAMAIGDVPPPADAAAPVPGFDLRWDAAALYRAFHAVWLPLFEAAAVHDYDRWARLLAREDLPAPDAIADHLGCGRGVLLRDGTSFTVRQQGALGGLELAALAMAWGPIVSMAPNLDHEDLDLELAIGRHRLEAAWSNLQAFRDKNGRWPKDLAELFAAGKLAPDALLMPGDDNAEPVALPAGTADGARSSFRYFPEPVGFEANGGKVRALLVEIRPRPISRLVLADDGATPEVFGGDSSKAIDRFGK